MAERAGVERRGIQSHRASDVLGSRRPKKKTPGGREPPAREGSGLSIRKAGPGRRRGRRRDHAHGLHAGAGDFAWRVRFCMSRRYVPAGKLHVVPPPSHRYSSVGLRAAVTTPITAAVTASTATAVATADDAAPAAAVSSGRCGRRKGGKRRAGSVPAAKRRTFQQKLRGRRLGRCVRRGRCGPG